MTVDRFNSTTRSVAIGVAFTHFRRRTSSQVHRADRGPLQLNGPPPVTIGVALTHFRRPVRAALRPRYTALAVDGCNATTRDPARNYGCPAGGAEELWSSPAIRGAGAAWRKVGTLLQANRTVDGFGRRGEVQVTEYVARRTGCAARRPHESRRTTPAGSSRIFSPLRAGHGTEHEHERPRYVTPDFWPPGSMGTAPTPDTAVFFSSVYGPACVSARLAGRRCRPAGKYVFMIGTR